MPDTLAPTAPTAPTVETHAAPEPEPAETDLAEALVEEVSIDGMCGVY
ncbi:mycofactocin precursor MftA [Lapillicoccus jejuensis]|uniref:Mycofactocin n=1 Tax=Lapillicoccus jejuensis TaxID=402171 RepID=A0A542E3E0_9MICO|nr:mycofactocin precursor MftA [Lapillicoccus jejuensis]TQJ09861.1 mycofactocin precursor [Lapillicoccus jejuensis]